ncbi:hypothetical protein BLN97_27075 [Bradyrhizobium elkanii]|nr:hypothetical protein BLN97_27075 [Bradyrhizobium elkanii]
MDTEPHTLLRSENRRCKIAILSRGDATSRREATAQNSRFVRVFEALAATGIEAVPVVYDETFVDTVRDQLLTMDGVLVWVDPIHQGKTRAALDPLLRDVAAKGPWVSAHPDVILKMGVKDVLYRTRHLAGAPTPIDTPRQGPDSPEAQPGPRIMHGPDAPQFQALRRLMEDEWIPQMMAALAIDEASEGSRIDGGSKTI